MLNKLLCWLTKHKYSSIPNKWNKNTSAITIARKRCGKPETISKASWESYRIYLKMKGSVFQLYKVSSKKDRRTMDGIMKRALKKER